MRNLVAMDHVVILEVSVNTLLRGENIFLSKLHITGTVPVTYIMSPGSAAGSPPVPSHLVLQSGTQSGPASISCLC